MKKKDVELVFKGADEKSWQELLDDLRPKGKWISDNWGLYHCNYCMKLKQQGYHNFCGNCGAKMEV